MLDYQLEIAVSSKINVCAEIHVYTSCTWLRESPSYVLTMFQTSRIFISTWLSRYTRFSRYVFLSVQDSVSIEGGKIWVVAGSGIP
jgi:hypothetical protein